MNCFVPSIRRRQACGGVRAFPELPHYASADIPAHIPTYTTYHAALRRRLRAGLPLRRTRQSTRAALPRHRAQGTPHPPPRWTPSPPHPSVYTRCTASTSCTRYPPPPALDSSPPHPSVYTRCTASTSCTRYPPPPSALDSLSAAPVSLHALHCLDIVHKVPPTPLRAGLPLRRTRQSTRAALPRHRAQGTPTPSALDSLSAAPVSLHALHCLDIVHKVPPPPPRWTPSRRTRQSTRAALPRHRAQGTPHPPRWTPSPPHPSVYTRCTASTSCTRYPPPPPRWTPLRRTRQSTRAALPRHRAQGTPTPLRAGLLSAAPVSLHALHCLDIVHKVPPTPLRAGLPLRRTRQSTRAALPRHRAQGTPHPPPRWTPSPPHPSVYTRCTASTSCTRYPHPPRAGLPPAAPVSLHTRCTASTSCTRYPPPSALDSLSAAPVSLHALHCLDIVHKVPPPPPRWTPSPPHPSVYTRCTASTSCTRYPHPLRAGLLSAAPVSLHALHCLDIVHKVPPPPPRWTPSPPHPSVYTRCTASTSCTRYPTPPRWTPSPPHPSVYTRCTASTSCTRYPHPLRAGLLSAAPVSLHALHCLDIVHKVPPPPSALDSSPPHPSVYTRCTASTSCTRYPPPPSALDSLSAAPVSLHALHCLDIVHKVPPTPLRAGLPLRRTRQSTRAALPRHRAQGTPHPPPRWTPLRRTRQSTRAALPRHRAQGTPTPSALDSLSAAPVSLHALHCLDIVHKVPPPPSRWTPSPPHPSVYTRCTASTSCTRYPHPLRAGLPLRRTRQSIRAALPRHRAQGTPTPSALDSLSAAPVSLHALHCLDIVHKVPPPPPRWTPSRRTRQSTRAALPRHRAQGTPHPLRAGLLSAAPVSLHALHCLDIVHKVPPPLRAGLPLRRTRQSTRAALPRHRAQGTPPPPRWTPLRRTRQSTRAALPRHRAQGTPHPLRAGLLSAAPVSLHALHCLDIVHKVPPPLRAGLLSAAPVSLHALHCLDIVHKVPPPLRAGLPSPPHPSVYTRCTASTSCTRYPPPPSALDSLSAAPVSLHALHCLDIVHKVPPPPLRAGLPLRRTRQSTRAALPRHRAQGTPTPSALDSLSAAPVSLHALHCLDIVHKVPPPLRAGLPPAAPVSLHALHCLDIVHKVPPPPARWTPSPPHPSVYTRCTASTSCTRYPHPPRWTPSPPHPSVYTRCTASTSCTRYPHPLRAGLLSAAPVSLRAALPRHRAQGTPTPRALDSSPPHPSVYTRCTASTSCTRYPHPLRAGLLSAAPVSLHALHCLDIVHKVPPPLRAGLPLRRTRQSTRAALPRHRAQGTPHPPPRWTPSPPPPSS
ncbi:hypothetical protein HF086_006296 [Spodoptera exigua]|uniref:Uncharacterized protein n=1 Tax=Spodoptera exigua TaxID=7107 RepID=A0A922M371_SPOEX|nr:hypothetical protein HF086_006296 [Spodoptera exigua]